MPRLRMIWAFVRTFWWVILLVLAVLFLGILYLVKRSKRGTGVNGGEAEETLIQTAINGIQGAVTDVKVERAVIQAETTMRKAELEQIRKEPDGKVRREKLASVLGKSL